MEKNVLFVVEGARVESGFFKRLAGEFSLNFDIYCLGANIYSLYKKMKEMEFLGNLKDVLADIHPEQKEILSKSFTYTYLIFDCDAHHAKKEETRAIQDIIADNFVQLEEMAAYFTDETDPTIGKLYINYPMMESFRDCDDFFDNNYENAVVKIDEINDYKQIVAGRKLCKAHVDKFTKVNFEALILQNIFKLNKISMGDWVKPNYTDYREESQADKILKKEKALADSHNILSVLNTSFFMIVDYFGNKNGFYDALVLK